MEQQKDLNISAVESAAYSKLLKLADTQGSNVVTPQVAVAFLSKSKLPQETLGKIWTLSDVENKGLLNQQAFFRALKLIACAQASLPIATSSLSLPTALPSFEGIDLTTVGTRIPFTNTGDVSSPVVASSTLTKDEFDRFVGFFQQAKPTAGLLAGDTARDLFLKSNLPIETLGKIWTLVDPSGSGKIPLSQFVVAMVLITRLRTSQIATVPNSIPTELWQSVSSFVSADASNSSVLFDTDTVVQNEADNNDLFGTLPLPSKAKDSFASNTNLKSDAFAVGLSSAATIVLSDEDKKQYAAFFDKLDVLKKGFVTGEQSSPFFLKSKLPAAELMSQSPRK